MLAGGAKFAFCPKIFQSLTNAIYEFLGSAPKFSPRDQIQETALVCRYFFQGENLSIVVGHLFGVDETQ